MTTYVEKHANMLSKFISGGGDLVNAAGKYGIGYPARGLAAIAHHGLIKPTYKYVVKPTAQVAGKLAGGAASIGAYLGAGITGAAAKNVVKYPLMATGTGAALYANKDNIGDVVAGRRYQNLVAPYKGAPNYSAHDQGFGRRIDPFHQLGVQEMEKTFSTRLPTMSSLEKTAESTFWAGIGKGALGAVGAGLAAPTLKTIGLRIQNRLFGSAGGADALTEYAKHQAKTLAKIEAVSQLHDEENRKLTKQVLPTVHTMFLALKSSDKEIAEAAKDKHLNGVMQQTMHTVSTFAPNIASDPRALQSVLREAISSPEGGLSFQTIKQLSETQKFINEARNKKWAD